MRSRSPALALIAPIALLAACSRGSATPPSGAAVPPSTVSAPTKESLGNVMVQVARRFELAGRAANAERFELAEFEAGEIEELFESDVPNADLPREGPTAHIPAMARAFLETNAPELKSAAAAKDHAAFAAAFQRAAAVCNGCHQAAAKGFIHVPSEPGKGVPELDPQPSSPGAPR